MINLHLSIVESCYIHCSNPIVQGQEDEQRPFILPIWKFSAEAESSLREPPSIDVSTKLINNFHKNGFKTTGSSILIRLEVGAPEIPKCE